MYSGYPHSSIIHSFVPARGLKYPLTSPVDAGRPIVLQGDVSPKLATTSQEYNDVRVSSSTRVNISHFFQRR
jgi:hypothetical protein